MSTSSVVRLDEYRGQRKARLLRALALNRPDPNRSRLIERIRDAIATVGADRGAVVWIDEYGPGLVHVHCVLDLLSDGPRWGFSASPLKAAWECGVPGLLDSCDASARGRAHVGPASMAVVALGSDGARAWFLVVDSVVARGGLSRTARGRLMFLAGECASVVLHRDHVEGRGAADAEPSASAEGFAGWAVLKDIEGHESDTSVSQRIASRFLVARAVKGFVDDDLTSEPDSLRYQIEGVRGELNPLPDGDPEEAAWHRLLGALEDGDVQEMASCTLDLATCVERQDHLAGAAELYRIAYRLAAACGNPVVAIDAARFLGRVHRRSTQWSDATRWYGYARDVARSTGHVARESVILDGLASTYRDQGNLPGAHALLEQALTLARAANDPYALGSVHQSLAGVEKMRGRLDRAIVHGWEAVRTHNAGEDWLAALTDLAGVFVEVGELQAAEDAYSVVLHSSSRHIYRAYALDALAYVAALDGDREEFERRARRADASGWMKPDTAPAMQAEFSYFRGKSYQALGDTEAARIWYARSARLAEVHGLNKFYFDATDALHNLEQASRPLPAPGADPEVMFDIRNELSAMREAVAVTP